MNCPKCSEGFSMTTDTRHGAEVSRDRMCPCGFTWTTVERIDDELYIQPLESMTLQEEVAYHRDEILAICQS